MEAAPLPLLDPDFLNKMEFEFQACVCVWAWGWGSEDVPPKTPPTGGPRPGPPSPQTLASKSPHCVHSLVLDISQKWGHTPPGHLYMAPH